MRSLVTGITGFVGRHLAPRLVAAGDEVLGLAYDPDGPGAALPAGVKVLRQDLANPKGLVEQVAAFRPERALHLAALSAQGAALRDPLPTFRVNALGTLHLLEALRAGAPEARLLHVSSAEVYGDPGEDWVDENCPIAPVNPYGASKAAAELLVRAAVKSWGLDAVVARSFPHAGPGQRAEFALPAFARQIAQIEAGRQEPCLRVGNLEARRDFLDVADVVAAYLLLLDPGKGVRGEAYNVCAGETHSIREGLDLMLAMSPSPIRVETDPALLRPADQPVLRGRPRKLMTATGWSPRHTFPSTLERVLADWRRRSSEEAA